jgi:hypothetical protein
MIVFISDDKSVDFPIEDITRNCNENREDVVSSVTVRRCLYRNNFHRRVVRKSIRIREANVKGRLAWAPGKRYWTVEKDWNFRCHLAHDIFLLLHTLLPCLAENFYLSRSTIFQLHNFV